MGGLASCEDVGVLVCLGESEGVGLECAWEREREGCALFCLDVVQVQVLGAVGDCVEDWVVLLFVVGCGGGACGFVGGFVVV